jgi:hypothetical protein
MTQPRWAGEFTKLADVENEAEVDFSRHGLVEILDASGDTKKIWDRNNADEVEDAKASFNRLTKKGYSAFYVERKGGEKAGRMAEFDPTAEGMILVPQIQGGAHGR